MNNNLTDKMKAKLRQMHEDKLNRVLASEELDAQDVGWLFTISREGAIYQEYRHNVNSTAEMFGRLISIPEDNHKVRGVDALQEYLQEHTTDEEKDDFLKEALGC